MTVGKFSIGIRFTKTPDFKWFYCPLLNPDRYHFFWWFGHQWYVSLRK